MDLPLLESLRLCVDGRSCGAELCGTPLALTTLEYRLLRTLAGDPTRVWITPELLTHLWLRRDNGSIAMIDRTAARLRAVLSGVDPDTRWLPHMWGIGYTLIDADVTRVVVIAGRG